MSRQLYTTALALGILSGAAVSAAAAEPIVTSDTSSVAAPTSAGPATTGTDTPPNSIVSKTVDMRRLTSGDTYWTPERMRAAKPYQPKHSRAARSSGAVGQRADEPTGQPVVEFGYPATDKNGTAGEVLVPLSANDKRNFSADARAAQSGIDPLGYSLPFPYTGTQVLDNYQQYPYSTVGKLFFSYDGGDYVCSASAVTSNNKRLVITAGHCVADSREWSSNVVFVPSYKDGFAPVGRWDACELYTSSGWFNDGDFARDIGAIKICDRNGKRLHTVTGALGFLANASRVQHWNSFGYPAAWPFTGERLNSCQSSHALDDDGSPKTIGVGCDMTGGSSGGPWLVNFMRGKAAGRNLINGVVSYGYLGEPDTMYSPYFGSVFTDLRDHAIKKGS